MIPVDEDARRRAREDLGTSLVLEAGAGTGKTTLLVDRIESLVRTGAARLEQIAAVTFTENAAATLKLRLRERLEKRRGDPSVPEIERRRAGAAVDVLERAQVSTIHAFCAAILQERPLECGVTPGFGMADEAQADAIFARAWEEWLAAAFDARSPTLATALREGLALEGFSRAYGEETSLRGLARTLINQRDLEPLVSDGVPDPEAWRGELLARAVQAQGLLASVRGDDLLARHLQKIVDHAAASRFLDGPRLQDHLLVDLKLQGNVGRKDFWRTPESLAAARELVRGMSDLRLDWDAAVGAAVHGALVRELQGVVRRYEKRKAELGLLDFVDLLVKARDGLRTRPAVRRHFAERWRYILVDEFQDTDPLQVQVLEELAGDAPGRLTVVGDAKQSIYRFRRAEVTLFREAARRAREREGHAVLQLTQNFRSRPGVLRFVNRVFGQLIQESEPAAQPRYEALQARPDLAEGPAVVALAFEEDVERESLSVEARTLAAYVAQVAAGAEQVRDPETGRLRKSRAGDVLILAPRLTFLRDLEEALVRAGLRFSVEGGKSFFNRVEVQDTLATLRAIDDPADEVSLVAALRSGFFGVSDTELVTHALSGGRLTYLGEAADEAPASIRDAFGLLRELHRERARLSVAAVLERLYDRTRILAALGSTRRGQAQAANLEKVAHLARSATSVDVLTLRGFTRLLQARVQDAMEEPDLSATRADDPDTVRILSIHKAKGLEAPVVALYDLGARLAGASPVIPLWEDGKVAIGFRKGFRPPNWRVLEERDKVRAQAESKRLLYVACTRARDLLVLPAPEPTVQVGDFWSELLPLVRTASADEVRTIDARDLPVPVPRETEPAEDEAAQDDAVAARWDRLRAARVKDAAERLRTPISATKAAARTAPPTLTGGGLGDGGSGGRSFGSLVHHLLEWADLASTDATALHASARGLAPQYGLDDTAAHRAAEMAAKTIAHPVMRRAAAAPRSWRELPVVFPDGADLIEGIVDLVFEEDGALVVVDYKTDAISDEQAIAQAAHHAPQLQLYGRALALATGMPVRERLVLFTGLGRVVPA